MNTAEMQPMPGIRALAGAELDQVNGGTYTKMDEVAAAFIRFVAGVGVYSDYGTLDRGLHR